MFMILEHKIILTMIRNKFYKNIITKIDGHYRFDSPDFKIESKDSPRDKTTILIIKYRLESKYKIIFKIPSFKTKSKDSYSSHYVFHGDVCPGPISYNESFSFNGEETVFQKIGTWLDCIWEELSSNPVVKQVENQQQQIEELFEKFESIEDGYFTNDETLDIRKRLDELEKTLKNQIKENEKDKTILEKEVSKLNADIDTLKQTVQSFRKKGWLKSFSGKMFKWAKQSDNQKILKEGYTIVKEFLPEEIKNTLPDVK